MEGKGGEGRGEEGRGGGRERKEGNEKSVCASFLRP